MQEAEMDEKLAQEEYEQFMADSAEKRANDSKAITDKSAQKAQLEGELQATEEALHDLHTDCDWLLENFDLRKNARANEIDALKKAKAVLSGANFSLLQTGATDINRH